MYEYFERYMGHIPTLPWNLLLIAIAVFLGLVVKFILTQLLKFNTKLTHFKVIDSVLKRMGPPVSYFLPVLAINTMLPLMRLPDSWDGRFEKTIQILLTVTFAGMLIGLVKIAEDYVTRKYDWAKPDNLRERKIRTQLTFLRKLAISLIVLLTVCAILLSFDGLRKVGAGLITGVGVGGIIIGFAAQKSLGNLLAGFQIAFTQPLRIDDVLVVEGEWGRVEEITLTYVVLNIWDKRRLILPINYFIEKPFQNWTRTEADILGTAFFYLDHTAPIAAMREELTRLLNKTPLWDKKVNVLQVTDVKERVIEIRALMSATNSGNAFDLRCYIRENMVTFIQEKYPTCLPKTRTIVDQDPSLDAAAGSAAS